MRPDWGILVRTEYFYISVRLRYNSNNGYRGLFGTVRELLSQPLIPVNSIANLYLSTLIFEDISLLKINYSGTNELVIVSFYLKFI